MDRIRQLPARETPLPGESLTSLLRRTAEAMGYKDASYIANLLPDKRLTSWNANRLVNDQSFDRLADILGCSPEQICDLTVHRYTSRFVLTDHTGVPGQHCDGKTILRYFTASAPICPGCLKDDAIPHERIAWTLKPLPVCLKHQCTLLDRCPSCQGQLQPNRRLLLSCKCGSDVRDWSMDFESNETVETAIAVTRWLDDETSLPNGISTAAWFWWMDRIRAAIEKSPACLRQVSTELRVSLDTPIETSTWITAGSVLRDWPDRFMNFLEILQHSSDCCSSPTIRSVFGQLPQDATKLEALGYLEPADKLRDYLLEHYTQGHLSRKICLFKSANIRHRLDRRGWMTQTQAAKRLGVGNGYVRELVQSGIIEGEVSDAGGRTSGLLRQDSVERLCSALRSSLSLNQTSKRVGVGPHRVVDLIHLKLLRAVCVKRSWRIMQDSIESLELVFRRLPSIDHVTAPWLTARQATRNFGPCGLTFARLWQNVCANKVRCRRLSNDKTLQGLVVLEPDIECILPDVQAQYFHQHGYPLHQLAKVLIPGRPTKERVLKKWIAMGMLHANRVGRSLVCTVDEIERFRQTYCLAKEARQLLSISRATLCRWESEDRIRPIYGSRATPGAGFSVYLRSDIDHLRIKLVTDCA